MALYRRGLLMLACAAPAVWAADDFWNRKPPEKWDAGEIYRLTNRSPWATLAEWLGPAPQPDETIGLPSPPMRSDGTLKLDRPRPTVRTVITWESARPLHDALHLPSAPVYETHYVIGVDGLPPVDYSNYDLRESATLSCASPNKWKARAAAAHERVGTSAVHQFAFPRAGAPIGRATREVVFAIELGNWSLESKFKPREMLYRGALSL
jgi:hypothetical protein